MNPQDVPVKWIKETEIQGGSPTHSVPHGEHVGREDSKQSPKFLTLVLDFEDQRVMGSDLNHHSSLPLPDDQETFSDRSKDF